MQPRILIAEDDDLQASLLHSALEGRGYQADIVTDGLEAVRRLRTGRYDLALLDYHIPEVDGHAAAALLRDFFDDANRPRLIAVTASAKGLSERFGPNGGSAFDAIVSKEVGLPSLLAVIDDNLTHVAEMNIALQAEWGRELLREAAVVRRRRRMALLGAAPGLIIAGAFGCGLVWAMTSLQHVDAAMGSARQVAALSAGTTTLLGAVQSAETSQRTYLATGGAADRELFESDMRHIDRLLVAPTSLSPAGMSGAEAASAPQAIIEPRLRTLTQEVQARHPSGVQSGVAVTSQQAGRDVAEQLRVWAGDLVSGSQVAALAGLAALRENIGFLSVVLLAGFIYALCNAGRAARHFWPERRAPLPMRQPATMTPTRLLLADGHRISV